MGGSARVRIFDPMALLGILSEMPEQDHQAHAALRRLPKVDQALKADAVRDLLTTAPRWAVVRAVREEIDRLRQGLLAAATVMPEAIVATQADPSTARGEADRLPLDFERVRAAVGALVRPSLRRVINATGVILHTNLGRAPLPARALARIAEVAGGYSNLEYRLDAGERGSRHDPLDALLAPLTGAEAHLVVNNNAAGVLLMLAGLCAGRQVVVSRGELVEIGGSFRIPDVMRASGAVLCEVGTTNRTHLRDYQGAITPDTAAFLKVHPSNFALVGFTAAVDIADLSRVAHEQGLLCLCDLGSGALLDPRALCDLSGDGEDALPAEPTVAQVIAEGCDLCAFSCDKLLGGPQAGVLCGRRGLILTLRKHPLLRALRPDKLTLLALSATLELYRDCEGLVPDIPVLRMLAENEESLRARAERLAAACTGDGLPVEIRAVRSAVGGGSLPLGKPRSLAVALPGEHASPDRMEAALRQGEPPVLCRIADDALLLDVRTLADHELAAVGAALCAAYHKVKPPIRGGPQTPTEGETRA